MNFSGDTDWPCLVSEGELAWFSMCTLLVTETVTCFVSAGELALFLLCSLPVTHFGASLPGGELFYFGS